MKALITGIGGFCGERLGEYLVKQGVQVCAISSKNIDGEVYKVKDIADVSSLASVISRSRPDYVFHLAGVSNADDISHYYRVNTIYGAALLQALKTEGREHVPVLLVGTSAEYGAVKNADLPIAEDTPAMPITHYGTSKLAQTLIGLNESRDGRNIVVARPFNIIGSGMPANLVVQSFVTRLKAISNGPNETVLEVGALDPIRDFIDVDDVIKTYWRLIREEAAYGQIVNICSGIGISIRDLLEKIINLSGVHAKAKPSSKYLKPFDISVSYGSVKKIENILGPMKRVDMDDSLKKILAASGL